MDMKYYSGVLVTSQLPIYYNFYVYILCFDYKLSLINFITFRSDFQTISIEFSKIE